ncbi:hypothetical protein [Neorhizobium sp. DAR64860/K0K1]|uniref:hypothetical protein n=1 Tax=Neorhizobium sp. DAR64860/K0K1 TaxID=3421955 RepID=UPI003D2AAD8A
MRADGCRDEGEFLVHLLGFPHHVFVHDEAEIFCGFDLFANSFLTLVDELDELLAAGSTENLIRDADLRGLIELLQTTDDGDEKPVWLLQATGEILRGEPKSLKRLGTGARAGQHEFVSAQAHFLEAVGESVNGNTVLIGNKLELLECLERYAGDLRLVGQLQDRFRGLNSSLPEPFQRADAGTKGKATDKRLAKTTDPRRRLRKRLVDPLCRANHVAFHGLCRTARALPEAVERAGAGLFGALHVPLEVADSCFKRDDQSFFIGCGHMSLLQANANSSMSPSNVS